MSVPVADAKEEEPAEGDVNADDIDGGRGASDGEDAGHDGGEGDGN